MLTDVQKKHDDDLYERHSRIEGAGSLVFESKYLVQTYAFKRVGEIIEKNKDILFGREGFCE